MSHSQLVRYTRLSQLGQIDSPYALLIGTFSLSHTARSVAVGLRMASGIGAAMGIVKFRNGTYLPQLVPQEESFEVRRTKRINSS